MTKRVLDTIDRYVRAVLNRLVLPFRTRQPTVREVSYRGHDFLALVNEDVGWMMGASPKRFEHAELEVLQELIRPDFVCLDVGANIGIYTVLLADMAPQGSIYAFEPDERAYHLLNLNLNLNGIRNAHTFNNPVSDREEYMSFHESVDSAFSSVEPTGRKDVRRQVELKSLTVDSFTEEQGIDPDFVKIDVEGYELAVLRGMRLQLADKHSRPKYLQLEVDRRHQDIGERTPGDVVSFLEERGYRAQSISYSGLKKGFDPDPTVQNVLFAAR